MPDKHKLFRLLSSLVCLCALAACTTPFGPSTAPPTSAKLKSPAGPCVVLGLPSSGPYAPIASRIRHGADMAKQEISARGTPLRLEVVNSEGPHWLAELSALPQECTVVGSPLQAARYDEARRAGLTEQRVFFTFLPSLEAGEEGARAWRFFPSQQDQIDALVAFATDGLGIHAYGAFYPADAFGLRMTGLLEQSLAARNMVLQKTSYRPADVTTWSDAATALLRPVAGPDGRTPVPQTAFEAILLPDSWKNMDMLVTSLLYNGEDRLVLLGTTLWEQGLSGRILANAEKFSLAVFPGAWNPAVAPAALKTAGDFWMSLGYDFTHFAAKLGLNMRPGAAEVNARLRALQMPWSMAPVFWDSSGVARQKLWIFQVSSMGMSPVNMELFAQNRAFVQQRAALRMQGMAPVDSQGNPLTPGQPANAAGAGMQPGAQGQPPAVSTPMPMSTTPRPSYKLSLPQAQ